MQTPPASAVDEAGKALARCIVEIEHLRATCKSPADVRTLELKLKAANDLLAVYKADVERLIRTGESRTTAVNARTASYEERIRAFEMHLADDQLELNRLRRERRGLRRGRNIAIGIIIALATSLAWVAGK